MHQPLAITHVDHTVGRSGAYTYYSRCCDTTSSHKDHRNLALGTFKLSGAVACLHPRAYGRKGNITAIACLPVAGPMGAAVQQPPPQPAAPAGPPAHITMATADVSKVPGGQKAVVNSLNALYNAVMPAANTPRKPTLLVLGLVYC